MLKYRDYILAKANQDSEAISKAVRALTLSETPQNFNPFESDNVVMKSEAIFEDTCAALEELGVTNPKELTEYEFYSRLRYYEKKHKNANN